MLLPLRPESRDSKPDMLPKKDAGVDSPGSGSGISHFQGVSDDSTTDYQLLTMLPVGLWDMLDDLLAMSTIILAEKDPRDDDPPVGGGLQCYVLRILLREEGHPLLPAQWSFSVLCALQGSQWEPEPQCRQGRQEQA
ncbi:hypothetical protein NDU88_008394 [Pleurodeles waltl]|uniref:Uncharacterized protein n=1 Tax=Pleurodeles waltl TaxID=8319 RepID=A0AAV7PU90_PLEWA|nr:hypothetical protein NDU88_008394 [Pleurodeles waltl]